MITIKKGELLLQAVYSYYESARDAELTVQALVAVENKQEELRARLTSRDGLSELVVKSGEWRLLPDHYNKGIDIHYLDGLGEVKGIQIKIDGTCADVGVYDGLIAKDAPLRRNKVSVSFDTEIGFVVGPDLEVTEGLQDIGHLDLCGVSINFI